LRSDAPLVVIEAPGGCGKTYQGAAYALATVSELDNGRLLILTHTHAACQVFESRTRGIGSRVEIKTIDSLSWLAPTTAASVFRKTPPSGPGRTMTVMTIWPSKSLPC